MYMEKSYHRPRATWLDSVCRYINDVFGHLCRAHITFLLEVYVAIFIIIGSQLRRDPLVFADQYTLFVRLCLPHQFVLDTQQD